MQIDAHTADWDRLSARLSEGDTDDIFEFMNDVPIVSVHGDSVIRNGEFGELFLTCEHELTRSDAAALRRFITSFCITSGPDWPSAPMDVAPNGLEDVIHSVMSPATLRELVTLPEAVDRRFLRAIAREKIAPGKLGFASAGEFFDYLDFWHRAYRVAAAENSGFVVSIG